MRSLPPCAHFFFRPRRLQAARYSPIQTSSRVRGGAVGPQPSCTGIFQERPLAQCGRSSTLWNRDLFLCSHTPPLQQRIILLGRRFFHLVLSTSNLGRANSTCKVFWWQVLISSLSDLCCPLVDLFFSRTTSRDSMSNTAGFQRHIPRP